MATAIGLEPLVSSTSTAISIQWTGSEIQSISSLMDRLYLTSIFNAVIAKPVNAVHMLFDVVHIPWAMAQKVLTPLPLMLASYRAERLHEKDCLLSDRYLKTRPRYRGSFQYRYPATGCFVLMTTCFELIIVPFSVWTVLTPIIQLYQNLFQKFLNNRTKKSREQRNAGQKGSFRIAYFDIVY